MGRQTVRTFEVQVYIIKGKRRVEKRTIYITRKGTFSRTSVKAARLAAEALFSTKRSHHTAQV